MARSTGTKTSYGFLSPKLSGALRLVERQLLQHTPRAAPKPIKGAGKGSGNRKLTDEQVIEMRRLWETEPGSWTLRSLAEKFGIKPGSVQAIVNYNTRAKAADGSWLK